MNDEDLLVALGQTARAMDARGRRLDDLERARMHACALDAMGLALPAAPRRAGGRHRWMRRYAFALPLVAAASLVLALRSGGVSPMPAYDLEVSTQDVQQRGAPATPMGESASVILSGDRLALVARPAAPIGGRATAHVFVSRDGVAREITPHVTCSDEGAVRVEGSVRALFAPPEGPWDVIVAIGRGDAAPPTPAQAVAPTFTQPGWTRVATTVWLK
jgi:hypothetical protein